MKKSPKTQICALNFELLTKAVVNRRLEAIDRSGVEVPLGDRVNMAYMGSVVSKGKGVGIVVSTGMQTQVGNIADRISKASDNKTMLQKRLDYMAYVLFGVSLLLALIVFATNDWSGETEVVLYAVAIAIAIIPEGLVAVVTLTMAIGVRSMAKQRALVRKLAAVEALGTITDICSDKTGTLTQAKMVASSFWTPLTGSVSVSGVGLSFTKAKFLDANGQKVALMGQVAELLRASALCNNASITARDDGSTTAVGDPTETALQVLAYKAKLGKPKLLKGGWKILQEHSFDSNVKRMSIIARHAVMKGKSPKSTPKQSRRAPAQYAPQKLCTASGMYLMMYMQTRGATRESSIGKWDNKRRI